MDGSPFSTKGKNDLFNPRNFLFKQFGVNSKARTCEKFKHRSVNKWKLCDSIFFFFSLHHF